MSEEVEYMDKNSVWSLVPRPPGARVMKSRWVYDEKTNDKGEVIRHRARLVAKGYDQRKGIDYQEVFAPVAKYATLRMLLAFAAQKDFSLMVLDVKKAFLNGKLEESVFMEQPEGFVSPENPSHVYELLKAIYGLKQAAKAWRDTLHQWLISIGAKEATADPCLYVLELDGQTVYLLVYVDDVLSASAHKEALDKVAKMFSSMFPIRIEEGVSKFLGISIQKDNVASTITIHSGSYIEKLLQNFAMEQCRPVSTPLNASLDITKAATSLNEGGNSPVDSTMYRQLVGALLHLSNTTRPDISFAVGLLSRFMENPTTMHWEAGKRVLRYLKGTQFAGIRYGHSSEGIVGFSNSDFAGDSTTRHSTSGMCFLMGHGAVTWRSKKQDCIAQSTSEAEYIASSYAVREALWLRKFMVDFGVPQESVPIFVDNQTAIRLAKEKTESERSKHVDVKYHFIRDHIAKGTVTVDYLSKMR